MPSFLFYKDLRVLSKPSIWSKILPFQQAKDGGIEYLQADQGSLKGNILKSRGSDRREPGSPATTGCLAQDCPTPQATQAGPNLLGVAVTTLDRMAICSDYRPTTDRNKMASRRLQTLLALEVSQEL
jgi:hypothetical protein